MICGEAGALSRYRWPENTARQTAKYKTASNRLKREERVKCDGEKDTLAARNGAADGLLVQVPIFEIEMNQGVGCKL